MRRPARRRILASMACRRGITDTTQARRRGGARARPRRRRRLAAHAAERRGDFITGLAAVPRGGAARALWPRRRGEKAEPAVSRALDGPGRKGVLLCARRALRVHGLGTGGGPRRGGRRSNRPGVGRGARGTSMTTTNATERADSLREAQALQPRDARTALIRAAPSQRRRAA